MRFFSTLTLLLCCSFLLSGQNHEHPHSGTPPFQLSTGPYCGKEEQASRSEREQMAKAFLKWKRNLHTKSAAPIRTIPVVFHLLEYDPTITNAAVENAVASLNNAYSHSQNNPAGDDYSIGTRGVDTKIEFCLAQRAPDGGLTNGIVRWRTDYENMDVDLEDAKLKTQGQWDPRYYLNIWVLAHLDTELEQSYTGSTWWTRESGLGGYSGGPGGVVGPDAKTDGVIVAGMGSALLAHEIGHYMSLAHTFAASCANDDCLVDGDGICDTPPDISKVGCGQNTCDTDTLSNYSNGFFTDDVLDMTSNFMDYSSCPNEFTQGQADKMLFVIDNQRIDLAVEAPSNNDACLRPCGEDYSIEFAISERYPEPNVAIDFSSSTLGTGIDTYEWYVEALGSPAFNYPVAWLKGFTPSTTAVGTAANLQHTFLDPGKYRVYLKAWNSANPGCYASYSRVVRVTCSGIDARFTPDVRLIASKQQKAKMLDSVLFRNRSVNATAFEWTVRHEPYSGMTPAQPDFISADQDLSHVFLEPGDYYITLIAKNGVACVDTCGPFLLPVLDPTIDGKIKLNGVDCYNEDSIRVAFKVFNDGFDTIPIGMPVTFYDEDPRLASPVPQVLGTFYLDKVVYGKENGENFVAIVPASKPKLDQIWAVFNDYGATTFPISWPTPDGNVMTVNSEFPASGENELSYDNNYSQKKDFQFRVDLAIPNSINCTDTELQLEASHQNGRSLSGVEWMPATNLSCNSCLDPIFTLQNTEVNQSVILSSEYFCKDTAQVTLPALVLDVPMAIVTRPPDLCPGSPPFNPNNFVTGTSITWYDSETANAGSASPPVVDTNIPGNYSLWVTDKRSACEGPKVEFTYTITTEVAPPTVSDAPTICVGENVPNLNALVVGTNITWHLSASGGTGSPTPPSISSNSAGTQTFWVSQSNNSCESLRVPISFTVAPQSAPPVVDNTVSICPGEMIPEWLSLVNGSNLLWYTTENGGTATTNPPAASSNAPGTYDLWVSQSANTCESPRVKVSYTIEVAPPIPVLSNIPDLCPGEDPPNLAEFVNGANISWYSSDTILTGSSSPPTVNTNQTGNYTFWVSQSDNNCESPRAPISLAILPSSAEPLIAQTPVFCVGDSVPLLSQFVSGANLQWYESQSSQLGEATPPSVSSSTAGTQTFWVSQSSNNCESPRVPISITIDPQSAPPIVTNTVSVCQGEVIPDWASLVTGSNLLWYATENGGTGTTDPPVARSSSPGSYHLWVSQSDNNCESPRVKVSYTIKAAPPIPQVTSIPDLCSGDAIPNLVEFVSGSNISWYSSDTILSGSLSPPGINTSEAGNYTFWVSQSEDNCESPRTPLRLTINASPAAPEIAEIPAFCVGDSVPALTQFVSGTNLKWYEGLDQQLGEITPPTIETTEARSYQFGVSQSLNACEGPTALLEVGISSLQITPSGPHEVDEDEPLDIAVAIDVSPSDTPYSIEWLDESGNPFDSDQLNTTVYPIDPTYYTVVVTAGGCVEEGDIEVDVIYQIDPTQIFSPNGDGMNDTWYIDDIDRYPNANVSVYNRLGALVYQAKAYNNGWEGRNQNGMPLPLATYYFVIDLNKFGVKAVTGHVTIIR